MTGSLTTSIFAKTVLLRVPFFCIAAVCVLLSGCGEIDEFGDGPIVSDARFSRTFRYYYEEECRFDDGGLYDCGRVRTLSPAYVVRIRIDGFGDASLDLDGYGYYFEDGSYDEGRDRYGDYFDFYDSNSGLTIYKDGSEMIIWDYENDLATVYSYEMW